MRETDPHFAQGELHRLLRHATAAHGLADAVAMTAHALLRYVPADAVEPVSPVRVQDLADERGCDPRTIRSHIRRLEAVGLVVDRCAGGGRRMIQRHRGRIVALQGVDFSPMLAAAETIALAALEAEAERDERRQLAARISELKRRLRVAIAEGTDSAERARQALGLCPARHRSRPLREMAALAARLELALNLLITGPETSTGRIFSPDVPEKKIRPNTTEKDDDPVCSQDDRQAGNALRHVTLPRLAGALPPDWRSHLEEKGTLNWSSLIETAYQRAPEIGVTDAMWAEAASEFGQTGAAVLVLLADADSVARNGPIRCPAAWVRAMTARAGEAPVRLGRNLFGLLHRRDTSRPLAVLVPKSSTRTPCLAS